MKSMILHVYDQLSSVLELQLLFLDDFHNYFPISVWRKLNTEYQIGKNHTGHWERENSSHKIKLTGEVKTEEGCGSEVHQWQKLQEAGMNSWPGHLAQQSEETVMFWPKRENCEEVEKSQYEKWSRESQWSGR